MKAERVALTPAFVLHQYAWRETSRVVEVWSREHGRVGLVARGVRRPRSPFRSLLQPFTPLLMSWSQRGELGNLTGLESSGAPIAFQGRSLMAGFYLNELLMRLLPRQDPHPGLYEHYVIALQGLAARQLAATLRIFEKNLLAAMGYGLVLTHTVSGDVPVEPGARYRYDMDSGLQPASDRPAPGLLISGRALLALHHEALDDADDLKAVKRLLRAALERHLDGRDLKTSGVMRAMSKGA
jgi:DNA repair protein RecO (recombination protein O)